MNFEFISKFLSRSMELFDLARHREKRTNLFETLSISTTGFVPEVKKKLKTWILEHGGQFEEDMTNRTTHLIAASVGTEKYRAALQWNLPIVQFNWIQDCVDQCQVLPYNTSTYTLKIFTGLLICTTGLYEELKQRIRREVVENGGQYDGDMEYGMTTHLIAEERGGCKFQAALDWGIQIVHPDWIDQCITRGYYVDEAPWTFQELSESQVIEHKIEKSHTAERLCFAELTWLNPRRLHCEIQRCLSSIQTRQDERLSCFDSCAFYMLGRFAHQEISLKQIIRHAMGTTFYDFNDQITHLVVGFSLPKEQVSALTRRMPSVFVISSNWIVQSCMKGRLQKEHEYPILYENEAIAEKEPPPSAKLSFKRKIDAQPQQEEHYHQEEVNCTAIEIQPSTTTTEDDRNAMTAAPATTPTAKSLAKKKFEFCRGRYFVFISNQPNASSHAKTEKVVQDNGGCVWILSVTDVLNNKESLPHERLVILLMTGSTIDRDCEDTLRRERPQAKFGTEVWLQCCISEERNYSQKSHSYFTNWDLHWKNIKDQTSGMNDENQHQNMVASVSIYSGSERAICYELLRMMGAKCTKKLSRKNTHLICQKPEGPKFVKAQEWKLIVCDLDWLTQCVLVADRKRGQSRLPLQQSQDEIPRVETPEEQSENVDPSSATPRLTTPISLLVSSTHDEPPAPSLQFSSLSTSLSNNLLLSDEQKHQLPQSSNDRVKEEAYSFRKPFDELSKAPQLRKRKGSQENIQNVEEDKIKDETTVLYTNPECVLTGSTPTPLLLETDEDKENLQLSESFENMHTCESDLPSSKPASPNHDSGPEKSSIMISSDSQKINGANFVQVKDIPGDLTQFEHLVSQLDAELTTSPSLDLSAVPHQQMSSSFNQHQKDMSTSSSIIYSLSSTASTANISSPSLSSEINPHFFQQTEGINGSIASQRISYECPVEANNRSRHNLHDTQYNASSNS